MAKPIRQISSSSVPIRINKTLSLHQPFILAPDDLRKIDFTLRRCDLQPVYLFTCADGIDRSVAALAGLLGYENPPSKSIEKISIHARSDDYHKIVHLTFDGSRPETSSIYMSFDSDDEDEAIKLIQEIEERIAGMRPWYSPIARFNFLSVAMVIVVSIFLLASIANVANGTSNTKVPLTPGFVAFGLGVLFTVYILPFVMAWMLNRVKAWAFPKVAFLIGQGRRRYENKDVIRNLVFGGLIIGTIASFIGSVLFVVSWPK